VSRSVIWKLLNAISFFQLGIAYFFNSCLFLCAIINDSLVKSQKSVTPAPIFIGINSSRSPDVVPRIKYGASSAELVPVKTGSREPYKGTGFPFSRETLDPCFRRNDKLEKYGLFTTLSSMRFQNSDCGTGELNQT